MLLQRGIGKGVELGGEASGERWAFGGRAAGRTFGGQVAGLAALLEIALDGRQGHLERADDIGACQPAVDSSEHTHAEILGVGRHGGSMHDGSLLKQVALECRIRCSSEESHYRYSQW